MTPPQTSNHTHTTPPQGAWFIYNYDNGAYPIGLHTDELEARRIADGIGYHVYVVFWPNGASWEDVKKV